MPPAGINFKFRDIATFITQRRYCGDFTVLYLYTVYSIQNWKPRTMDFQNSIISAVHYDVVLVITYSNYFTPDETQNENFFVKS